MLKRISQDYHIYNNKSKYHWMRYRTICSTIRITFTLQVLEMKLSLFRLVLWYNFYSIHETDLFVFFSNNQHTGNNYRFLKHNWYMFMNLLFGKLIVIHIYFRYQSSLSHLHLKLYYFRVRSIRMSKNYYMLQYRYHNILCQRYYNYFCFVG